MIGDRFDESREIELDDTADLPEAGELLNLGPGCGVPFTWRPILFRVIRAFAYGHTPDGCLWLEGYELDRECRHAVERRQVFVETAGLRRADTAAPARGRTRKPRNAGPLVPRQRTSSSTTANIQGAPR